jgi:CheY-like chemotaxis protein
MARDLQFHNSRSVLIVDDDDEIRAALRLLLEASDLPVVAESSNGIEASYLAYRHQPELVILDYFLPQMNGEETSYIVRFLAPRARIMAFSSMLSIKPLWADAYLSKERIGEIGAQLELLLLLNHDGEDRTFRKGLRLAPQAG